MISRTSNSSPAAARQWQLFGKKQLGRSLPVGQFSTTRIDSDRHRRTSITRCNITGKAKTTHSSSWEAQCIKMLLCHFIVWPGGHWHWHWQRENGSIAETCIPRLTSRPHWNWPRNLILISVCLFSTIGDHLRVVVIWTDGLTPGD